MRLQYYEDKRRVYTLQLEGTVKSGVIEAAKNDIAPIITQPTAMSRSVQHHRTQSYGGLMSPKTAISKHGMNFVQDYGLMSPQSTMPPEIALRDPLDQEFVLNRKMAKKYYEKQLQEKMQSNKALRDAEREKRKKEIMDKEAKKQAEIEK